jgi:hypothetical protein
MPDEKECKTCFGTGMVEHKSCNGLGCDRDGCEDGEIICPKCDGLGYLTKGKANPEEEDLETGEEIEEEIIDNHLENTDLEVENEQ